MYLISNKSHNDIFAQKITEITLLIRQLGQVALNKNKADKALKKLMLKWVEFDNTFTQFPPVWAKKDKNWKKKFQNLADFIAVIIKNYKKNNLQKAHTNILSLSRRILCLFEKMPLDQISRHYITINLIFDKLWQNFFSNEKENFADNLQKLSYSANGLAKIIASDKKHLMQDFLNRIKELRLFSTPIPPAMNNSLYTKLELTEEAFRNLNNTNFKLFDNEKE